MRTIIIGNSGSGKTWLATQLARKLATPLVHLDDIFWLPGGFNTKRAPDEVLDLIESAKLSNAWIVEGVFSDLAIAFLPDANMLIWLDLPLNICLFRLQLRGSQSKAHMSRKQSEAGLKELSEWTKSYTSRLGSTSFKSHLALFESFSGIKYRFKDELQIAAYLNTLQPTQ